MYQEKRVKKTIERLKEENISQLLISDPVSIQYYLGKYFFAGERFLGLLLAENRKPVLFLNKLFPYENADIEIAVYLDGTKIEDILDNYIDHNSTLAVDKKLSAQFLLPLLQNGFVSNVVNGSFAVDKTREIKFDDEKEALVESSALNDAAMEQFKKLIVPGVTEKQLAAQMHEIYKKLGAEKVGFTIVAFGQNAANPHHMPDDTVLNEGDCVLFDVGAIKNNYFSDMTRTFFFRNVSEKQKLVYETVKKANEEAEKFVRPGVRFSEVDAVARNIISDAGFGEYFTHRLGHGIGLEAHEGGDVSASNDDVIKEGMVFSIEPGIYLPGEFGVRIEDLVLVTEDGAKPLNHYNKQLQII